MRESAAAVLAVLIAVVFSIWNMAVIFADPYDMAWTRIVYLVLIHAVPALLVGVMIRRQWYLTIILPWAAILIAVAGLISGTSGSGPYPPPGTLLLYLFLLPLLVLGLGFAGSRIPTDRTEYDEVTRVTDPTDNAVEPGRRI